MYHPWVDESETKHGATQSRGGGRAEVVVGPEKKSPKKEGGSMEPLRGVKKDLHLHGGVPFLGCVCPSCRHRRPRHGDLQKREDKWREVRRKGWAKKEGRDQHVPDPATSGLAVAGCGGSQRSFGEAPEPKPWGRVEPLSVGSR